MLLIALDPAADGAAVLMSAEPGESPRVLSACAWRLGQRDGQEAWILSWFQASGLDTAATPGELGWRIGTAFNWGPIASLVIEAPYVYRNPHTALRIARFGGFVAGGIQAVLHERGDGLAPHAVEIQPSAWRAILGLSAGTRAEAKARSLAGVPNLVPSLRPALERLGQLDHLTDAAGIGLCGFLHRAEIPGFEARIASATTRKPKRSAGSR